MTTYAIGDLQGCHDELLRLLDQLRFDPTIDRLWLVGDLVNRGPKSLQCLRFVRELGSSAAVVLGNHDLHLLALAAGNVAKNANDPGIKAVLEAPDRDELLDWLRHRPLLHRDQELGFTMIHAGLPPQWDLATAAACAREVEQVLRGVDHQTFLLELYGNKPKRWDAKLKGITRLRFITNCFTRLRYCSLNGELSLKEKGPPGSQADGLIPWYRHPTRASRHERIVFGHWSTLGYRAEHNVWSIDTACLWGGALTALRLNGPVPQPHHMRCPGRADPKAFAQSGDCA